MRREARIRGRGASAAHEEMSRLERRIHRESDP
jgi:hypothetical protein